MKDIMQVILYPNPLGGVCIIYPTLEYADQIEAIAAKDVPEGLPFVIIAADALPDRATRDAWLWADFTSAE